MNNRQKLILQTELSKEDKTISELRQIYEQALIDSNTKIMELSMRTDMQNLQAIVYQKQYQEAIKGQLEGILDQLNANQYATVSDYLKDCYIDGFVGNMYDLAGQGIPMIVPINQNQVVKAIQTDSKLSKSLYTSLGENVQYLKTAVRVQVSRGIANGSTWNEIAQHLAGNFKNTPFEKAINNTIRIARTEGHRVQNAAKMDAMNAAKEKGADIVKQWDSTMDGRTRETHRKLDGQIRELDEPFEVDGMKADSPSHFGDPAEDINCRCAVLQRAKWALDKDELETLQQRAEYFGIDKTDDFDDFKDKYMKGSSVYDLSFKEKPNATISSKQKYEDMLAVSDSYTNMPIKVKQQLSDVTFEFGYDSNACDIANKIIQVGIGTTAEQINHEYGHLIENYMMDKNDVDNYKMFLTKGLTISDIKLETYYNNIGQPISIYVLNGKNFESEYQSRLYISNPLDALNPDGTIKIDVLGECISEPFRKYMNKEPISDEARKLIEGAIL